MLPRGDISRTRGSYRLSCSGGASRGTVCSLEVRDILSSPPIPYQTLLSSPLLSSSLPLTQPFLNLPTADIEQKRLTQHPLIQVVDILYALPLINNVVCACGWRSSRARAQKAAVRTQVCCSFGPISSPRPSKMRTWASEYWPQLLLFGKMCVAACTAAHNAAWAAPDALLHLLSYPSFNLPTLPRPMTVADFVNSAIANSDCVAASARSVPSRLPPLWFNISAAASSLATFQIVSS